VGDSREIAFYDAAITPCNGTRTASGGTVELLTRKDIAERMKISASSLDRIIQNKENNFPRGIAFSDAPNATRRVLDSDFNAWLSEFYQQRQKNIQA
jgi:hypothetical protein